MRLEEDILSVKQAAVFYELLKSEMDEEDKVIIDFTAVERVDISIIQILVAAGREMRNQGKILKLKGVSETVKEQMNMCGLRT